MISLLPDDSTFDDDSTTLYLYDIENGSSSGNLYESKDAGKLNMRMPLTTVKTVQFVDVTNNPDYMQTYGALVSELIDTELPVIQAAYPGITTINRWQYSEGFGCINTNSDKAELNIVDLS